MTLPAVMRGCLIEARDVIKSFGQTPALRGASVATDQGEVWFDGQRLDTLDEAERTRLRRTVFGFVFQFGQLVPELTTADNVALPLLLNRVRRRTAYNTADA